MQNGQHNMKNLIEGVVLVQGKGQKHLCNGTVFAVVELKYALIFAHSVLKVAG